jgi:hypothetical protein
MLTVLCGISLMIAVTPPADSVSVEDVYLRAADAILGDSATALFLRRGEGTEIPLSIGVAESLYTLDRFPFDTSPGDSAVSVYKADMLRPVRAYPVTWPPRFRGGATPAGILFISLREKGFILGELFVFDPILASYEAYCIARDSLKFLLHVTRSNLVSITGRVRLLR